MADVILTGASRGIGRALAEQLPPGDRLILVARDTAKLNDLVQSIEAKGGSAIAIGADLSIISEARAAGDQIASLLAPGATLIHNAGVWPHTRELTRDGLERAFATNHLGPFAFQQAFLEARVLRRILVIGAGLMIKGRFDASRTPAGEDFSSIRTYCTTKLAFATIMRDVASSHPQVDVAVIHPGVVRTDLGARPGLMGWLLSLVKKKWEAPETTAARLVRILERDHWSPPGVASWFVEEEQQPWPAVAEDDATRASIRGMTWHLLSRHAAG